jgi:hypothetical protein
MSSSSTPCGKHIDFDKEATSYLVHDLLLSFLYSYAHIQDDTQRSALARQELLARAVTELLHHFSFPAHVSIPVVDMCILLRVRTLLPCNYFVEPSAACHSPLAQFTAPTCHCRFNQICSRGGFSLAVRTVERAASSLPSNPCPDSFRPSGRVFTQC